MPLQEFNNIVNLLYRTISTDDPSSTSENSQKKVSRRLLRFLAILRPILVDAIGTDDDGKLYIFSSSNLTGIGTGQATSFNGTSAQDGHSNNNNNTCDLIKNSNKVNSSDEETETVFTGLSNYRPYQVEVVLKTLNNLIHRMPVKEDGQIMEGRILLTLPFYLDLLEDFLSQDTPQFLSSLPRSLGSFQKDTIVTSVLSLLYHPILFLDLKLVEVVEEIEDGENRTKYISHSSCVTNDLNDQVDIEKFSQPPRIQLFSSIDMSEREMASLSCAVRIIELVARYEPCLYSLYDNYEFSNYYVTNNFFTDDGEESESNAIPFALGIVGCVSLGLQLVPTEYFVPVVLSHEYELGKHVPFISPLLESTDQVVHEKGLLLLRNLIANIDRGSLTGSFYEECISKVTTGNSNQGSMDQLLLKIAIFSNEENIRTYARDLYGCLFHCFNPDGMFIMLMSNLCSRAINQYPSAITFLLFSCHKLVKSEYFQVKCGPKLKRLIQQIIKLSMNAGAETDLCENHDVILESLNLIRFFALKSQSKIFIVNNGDSDTLSGPLNNIVSSDARIDHCVHAFWSIVPEIKKKMLRPLRSALDLSRAHFTLEITKLENESVKSARNRRLERIREIKALDLKVLNELKNNCSGKGGLNNDQDLLSLPENHERDIISMSLVKFDLIESMLAPITDLLQNPK